MQLPRVKEALAKLDELPPDQRMEAFKKLREIYREAAGQEFMKLRERGESKDGFRRPPPEQDKPAPPAAEPKP